MADKTTKTGPHLEALAVLPGSEDAAGSIETEKAGAVALVRVQGVLSDYADPFSAFEASGDVASLEHLTAVIRAADADPRIGLTLLDFNGAGVRGGGVTETMGAIRESKTPTAAYVSGTAASGVAMLAASADRTGGHSTSEIRSVNWRIGFQPREAGDGGPEFFSLSELKADEANGKLSAAVKKDIDARLQAMESASRAIVQEARGLTDAQAAELFSGRSFVGQAAVDVGALDGIHPTRDAFVASLTQKEAEMAQDTAAAPNEGAATQTTEASASTETTDERGLLQRIAAMISGAVSAETPAAVSPTFVKPPGSLARAEDAPAADPAAQAPDIGAEVAAAVAAAVKPLQEQVATLQADRTATAAKSLKSRLEACATERRIRPGEVAVHAANVETLTLHDLTDAAEAFVAGLEAQTPRSLPADAFEDLSAYGAPADGSLRPEPVPEGCTIDREAEARVAKLLEKHEDDPVALDAALAAEAAAEARA